MLGGAKGKSTSCSPRARVGPPGVLSSSQESYALPLGTRSHSSAVPAFRGSLVCWWPPRVSRCLGEAVSLPHYATRQCRSLSIIKILISIQAFCPALFTFSNHSPVLQVCGSG